MKGKFEKKCHGSFMSSVNINFHDVVVSVHIEFEHEISYRLKKQYILRYTF